jgi:hypothetical protein
MKPGLINRVEKVIAAAEAELELADAPLTLGAIVVGEEDEEAAKARILVGHLEQHPQDAGRQVDWTIFRIGLVKPPGADESVEVHYTSADGLLTLTNAESEPIEIDGRRFSRQLLPGDDEAAVAEELAREAHLGA